MAIGVVIPVLNERQRVESLLEKAEEWHIGEVIFVDGGSTDGTQDILDALGAHWIASRQGRALQMNEAARRVRGDILVFLHADTDIGGDAFKIISALFERYPDVVGGRFDVRLSGNGVVFRLIEFMINFRSRLTQISTGDQAMFVRRDVFESLGGFPEQPILEDIEFSRRLKRAGHVICLRNKVVTSSRRWEQHGILRTILLMWKIRLLYWFGVSPDRLAKMYRADVR